MRGSIQFGRFQIRFVERQLLAGGHAVALGARAFDLLEALIERRGRLVTKSELIDVVWPGLEVEESNLSVQVSTLRKIVGAQTIATVPGRGYRFAAVVSSDLAMPPPQATPITPGAPMTLHGRERDIAALVETVLRQRMVTVVGAGGVGKTSLAMVVAHAARSAFEDGSFWVDLAPLGSASLVAAAVAQSLRLGIGGGTAPTAALVAALEPMRTLLVLDNAEHVIDEVAELAGQLLREATGVHLLVTSQQPAKVDGEAVYRLEPLDVPDGELSAREAMASGSVAMFVDQCLAIDRRFELTDANANKVIALCRHLDGLPLAIKLAAARLPLLGLNGLQARLGERLKLLAGENSSVPVRQRTLQATLEWSHALLAERERRVLRGLAVFAGGFTLDLAMAVVGEAESNNWAVADSLSLLIDRSLVVADGGDAPRYRLLETNRDYALQQLAATGGREATQRRHAQAMAQLFEDANESFWSSTDRQWLDRFAPETCNVRAALDWCESHDRPTGLALTSSAAGLFILLGQVQELRRLGAAIEPVTEEGLDPKILARYWMFRSFNCWTVDHHAMLVFARRAEHHSRTLGDLQGVAKALCCAALSWMLPAADADRVVAELKSFDSRGWPPRLRTFMLDSDLQVLYSEGRIDELLHRIDALRAAREHSMSSDLGVFYLDWLDTWIVLSELESGTSTDALRMAHQFLDRRHDLHDRRAADYFALSNLARCLIKHGAIDESRRTLAALFSACRIAGWQGFGFFGDLCTLLALCEGRHRDAATLVGYAHAAWRRIARPPEPSVRFRARALATLRTALDDGTIAKLEAMGALLNEEAVCALTLSSG